MRSDHTDALRYYLDEARQHLSAEAAVSVLSQMLVIVRMAREEPLFSDHLISIIESGGYVKDILAATRESLESKDIENRDQLIDMSDKGWSAVSGDTFYEFVVRYHPKDIDLLPSAIFVASYIDSDRGRGIRAPKELAHLMYRLLGEPKSLLLPSAHSAIAGLYLAETRANIWYYADNEWQSDVLARLFFVCGCHAQRVTDLREEETQVRLPKSVLLVPAFGARTTRADYVRTPVEVQGMGRLAMEELRIAELLTYGRRKVVALVPTGTLSSGGGSPRFRRWLYENSRLSTVIEFPERLLTDTAIGCALFLIGETNSTRDRSGVELVDASTERYVSESGRGRFVLSGWHKLAQNVLEGSSNANSVFVSEDELYANDFVLQPSRYLAKVSSGIERLLAKYPVYPLSSIAEIRLPTPIRTKGTEFEEDSKQFKEVRISDFMKSGTIIDGSKNVWLDRRSLGRIDKQRLRPGDILVGTKGTIGKAALVKDTAPANLLAGLTTARVRLKKDGPITDPEFVIRYLALPAVQSYLDAMSSGATIQFIKAKDLAALPVPVPPLEIQKKVTNMHDKIQSTIDTIERLEQEWRHLSERAFDILEEDQNV